MTSHDTPRPSTTARAAGLAAGLVLFTSACAAGGSDDAANTTADATADTIADIDNGAESDSDIDSDSGAEPDTTVVGDASSTSTAATTATTESEQTESTDAATDAADAALGGCEDVAASFVTRGSANADLEDPEVTASCEGDDVVVASNGIPDYTYIETSPGQPTDRDHTFVIPATPTIAEEPTDVPLLGTAAVSLGGIPIFGPTEGTGGDVESLPGILSDCGSHNGPSGFHIHLILTTPDTDCLFTPAEVAAEPQLVGYAFDGFPIYTGIDQYTSSWELTDETLFATDTWAAHTYVEGSGDLDECNGLTDADGQYAYYTTATFPYVLGCYTGVVDLDASGGGGGGGGGGGDAGANGARPERPEGDADEDRPQRPEETDEDRPERPEGDDGVRPQRPGAAGAPTDESTG